MPRSCGVKNGGFLATWVVGVVGRYSPPAARFHQAPVGGAVVHKRSGKAAGKGEEGSVGLRIPSLPGWSLRGSNRALKGRVSLGLPTLPTSKGHLQPPKKEDAVEEPLY